MSQPHNLQPQPIVPAVYLNRLSHYLLYLSSCLRLRSPLHLLHTALLLLQHLVQFQAWIYLQRQSALPAQSLSAMPWSLQALGNVWTCSQTVLKSANN